MENILEITRLALGNERLRAELASINIARANTPIDPNKIEKSDFQSHLTSSALDSQSNLSKADSSQSIRYVYEPKSNYANSSGFVAYPDIDLATEFVTLTLSKRAYEANVRVFNSASKMHAKTLELGRI